MLKVRGVGYFPAIHSDSEPLEIETLIMGHSLPSSCTMVWNEPRMRKKSSLFTNEAIWHFIASKVGIYLFLSLTYTIRTNIWIQWIPLLTNSVVMNFLNFEAKIAIKPDFLQEHYFDWGQDFSIPVSLINRIQTVKLYILTPYIYHIYTTFTSLLQRRCQYQTTLR